MAQYLYKYKDISNNLQSDVIEAATRADALEELRSSGKFVVGIKEMSSIDKFLRNGFNGKESHGRVGKIDKKTISMFFSQLAFMRSSGLDLYKSISTMVGSTSNKALRNSLVMIQKSVSAGNQLSTALEEQKSTYGISVIYQIRAGEKAGTLDTTMRNIAHNLDKEVKFKNKVKSAMTYPMMIVIATVVIVYFLMTKVVPSMSSAITGMGGELPFITVVVMKISEIVTQYTGIILTVTVTSVGTVLILYNKTYAFKYVVDSFILKVPYVGDLILKLKLTTFCRLLGSLQKSGVSLVPSLDIVKDAIGNAYITKKLVEVRDIVERDGRSLQSSLKDSKIFPELLVQLVEVGSQSGTLPEVLELMASNYEEEVDDSLKKVLSYVDTLLILIIGAVVGTVVVSMFLPMFGFIDQL